MELAKVLKRQDPNLIRGMVTVDKELSTHLYRETEYFSSCLWVSPLVKKCMLPAHGDEPVYSELLTRGFLYAPCARG